MCGITGFLSNRPASSTEAAALASRMAQQIAHRGPDDSGVWVDATKGVAFGHRRLSIIDLTAAGHQPMVSASGRHVVIYNGEIYNHLEVRAALESEGAAPAWRGHSDTETLLAAVSCWGVERTLKALVGMFAIALWDVERSTLILARDRMGEKPLYYGWQGDTFLFGSEIKALRAHPVFSASIDRDALALLLRHNYIPTPYSIFRGIRKLPPGTLLEVSRDRPVAEPRSYWCFTAAAELGKAAPLDVDESEAIEGLQEVLSKAVQGQRISDVPLGALISGGVDSSTIVALMQARDTRPVRTFTIGFAEKAYDEAGHAAAIARHLGTDHTEVILSSSDALKLIPGLPLVYDEPFADSSQLPTQLVMQVARRHVTVALSGDGGDELFGGYNRYMLAPRVWKILRFLPMPMRRVMGRALLSLPATRWNRLLGAFPATRRIVQPGDKVHKLGNRLLYVRDLDDLFFSLVSEWTNPGHIVLGATEPATILNQRAQWPVDRDRVARMMALDTMTYLPDDILVKVDRAAMSASLETRAPFLDHRVVEYACRLPTSLKIRGDQGKWVLRQMLYRHIPRTLIERPKMGFGIPLDAWLRGPLREWAESLLDETRLRRDGYFDPVPIRRAWESHISGGQSFGYRLWSVLMFQSWLEGQAVH